MKNLIILALLWPMVLFAQSPFEFTVAHTYPQGYHTLHSTGNILYAITADSSQVHQLFVNLPNGVTPSDTLVTSQPAISLDVVSTLIFTNFVVVGELNQIEIYETGVNGSGLIETIPIDGAVEQVQLNLDVSTLYAVVVKNGQREMQLIQYDPFAGSFVQDSLALMMGNHQVAFYDSTIYAPAVGFAGTDLQLLRVENNTNLNDTSYHQLVTGPMQSLSSNIAYNDMLYITHDNSLTSHTLTAPLDPVLSDSVGLDFMGMLAIQDLQHFGIASPDGGGFQALQKDNFGIWQQSNILPLSAAKAISAATDYFAYATADSLYVIANKMLTGRKDVLSSLHLSLYPNPTSDLLHFDVAPEKQSRIEAVEIIDVNGRVVFSQQGLTNEVSTNGLAQGLYILRLQTTDGQLLNRRFLKQ